jgi:tetraacyldisaccharide 4'-kinase
MATGPDQFAHRILSGQARGVGPAILRGLLRGVEPIYAAAMRLRNAAYRRGIFRAHKLPRPVVSVGNITAGGTGKTPMVQWLADRLRAAGHRPAVLLRGYKASGGHESDEARMLADALRAPDGWSVPVEARPDRLAGGLAVLQRHPDADVFLLDDGFQHRRLHRDFDLVLIAASEPFGFGHVHPRGLLREPLAGLGRAHAFVVTRADGAWARQRRLIETTIRQWNGDAPIYFARHVHRGLRSGLSQPWEPPDQELAQLKDKRFFAFAGIADPVSLHRQLLSLPGQYVGSSWFSDHHRYTADDLAQMRRRAGQLNADVILVTQKDWPKLSPLASLGQSPPLWRIDLRIEFEADGEAQLIEQIGRRLGRALAPPPS